MMFDHIPVPVIIPITCRAVSGSTIRARTSPAIATNTVQNTFFTCSFFPNASMTASASAIIARRISFGRKTKSGRNRTAAPMNARVISALP
jgi:hypothetical protein